MIATTTIYNGSVQCPCGRWLTPLEALCNTDGLCAEDHADRVARLMSNGMVEDASQKARI